MKQCFQTLTDKIPLGAKTTHTLLLRSDARQAWRRRESRRGRAAAASCADRLSWVHGRWIVIVFACSRVRFSPSRCSVLSALD